MTEFLFTIYTIKTMITQVEAEDVEEAKEKIGSGNTELTWLQIPEATFSFFSTKEDDNPIGESSDGDSS